MVTAGGGTAAPFGAQVLVAAVSRASQGCSWTITFPMWVPVEVMPSLGSPQHQDRGKDASSRHAQGWGRTGHCIGSLIRRPSSMAQRTSGPAPTWKQVLERVLHPGTAEGCERQGHDLARGNAFTDQPVQLSNLRGRMHGFFRKQASLEQADRCIPKTTFLSSCWIKVTPGPAPALLCRRPSKAGPARCPRS